MNASQYYDKLTFAPTVIIFTALHEMQTRSSDEHSVRPSVCLTNACIVTKRNKDRSRFYLPYVTVVEGTYNVRKILCSSSPTFGQNYCILQRCLYVTAEHLVIKSCQNATYTQINNSFYRAAYAMRSSHEKAVCPSVRLSCKRVHCDKTEERSVQIFIPYERSLRRRRNSGEQPVLPEILGEADTVGEKSPIFSR